MDAPISDNSVSTTCGQLEALDTNDSPWDVVDPADLEVRRPTVEQVLGCAHLLAVLLVRTSTVFFFPILL